MQANLGLSLESRNLDKGCLTAVHQHVAYPITIRYGILQ